jgi:hypothetical protein
VSDVSLPSAEPRAGRVQAAVSLPRWFAVGLLVLAALLVGNTLLGPLVTAAITYPFSET